MWPLAASPVPVDELAQPALGHPRHYRLRLGRRGGGRGGARLPLERAARRCAHRRKLLLLLLLLLLLEARHDERDAQLVVERLVEGCSEDDLLRERGRGVRGEE